MLSRLPARSRVPILRFVVFMRNAKAWFDNPLQGVAAERIAMVDLCRMAMPSNDTGSTSREVLPLRQPCARYGDKRRGAALHSIEPQTELLDRDPGRPRRQPGRSMPALTRSRSSPERALSPAANGRASEIGAASGSTSPTDCWWNWSLYSPRMASRPGAGSVVPAGRR